KFDNLCSKTGLFAGKFCLFPLLGPEGTGERALLDRLPMQNQLVEIEILVETEVGGVRRQIELGIDQLQSLRAVHHEKPAVARRIAELSAHADDHLSRCCVLDLGGFEEVHLDEDHK